MINAFANMVGVTMVKVTGHEQGSESMTFHAEDGRRFVFYHLHDYCESVYIEDFCGDVEDLIGSPFLLAEEVSSAAREARLDRLSSNHTFDTKDLVAEAEVQKLCDVHAHVFDTAELEKDIVDSFTWTFYRFATAKGHVTVRWLGVSNGYYSESVSYREDPA